MWSWASVKGSASRLIASFAMLGAAVAAFGFTIDESLTNRTPIDLSDDLNDAARWSNVPGSFVTQGVRGLGGGLEYTVASDFCTRMIPLFVDAPTCTQLRQSIQQAFDLWADPDEIGAVLDFVDVSERVQPQLPPQGVSDPWRGYGSEIDILVLSPEEFPSLSYYAAWTQFWYLYADPIGTNGRVLTGNTLTSVDLVFNTAACYHLDAALTGRGCNHFGSLLLHEIGHALSLDHPNESGGRNFDSDGDPTNSIPIDCESPTQGLKLSSSVDTQAVMNSSQGMPQPVRTELSADDLGGRNFLYPICTVDSATP